MTIEGGCRCGATRYTVAIEALPQTYACHCLHCQTWSGSAFTLNALLPEALLAVTGPVAWHQHDGTGGHLSRHQVCGICHTRIANTNGAVPGLVVLRVGTLDDSDRIAPIAHIWTRRKQPWLVLPADIPNWPEAPSPDAFAMALRASPGDAAG